MEMEIRSGDTRAMVDPQGGWVSFLSDKNGEVFYPRRVFEMADGLHKVRGGCHVCLPNFGPGGDSGQPQHGFGRTKYWKMTEWDDAHVVLMLEGGDEEYKDMMSFLTYSVGDKSFIMTLSLFNKGQTTLRVAPAFHPYFAVSDSRKVTLDEESLDLTTLEDTRFVGGEAHELETSGRIISLDSKDLTTWAQWTDMLGKYVCVEPSFDGNAFLRDAEDAELLEPGEERRYTVTLSWTDLTS